MFKLLKKLILRRKLKQVSKKFKEESIPLIEEVFSSLPEMVDSDGGPAAPIVFTAVDDICTSPYGYKRSIHRAWRHSFYVLRQHDFERSQSFPMVTKQLMQNKSDKFDPRAQPRLHSFS
ncbi:uncharacterized protein [Parasteatoda tepidariorum]|uniref:uncharacterized protein isoform X4 n=1 Tax=Parasteatoda tepidariorum TaxID=114398 RepID=UPI001C726602|nr:uncharacterized protein LOC122271503 isoform X3 [Parasteatoda tepidariorum]